MSLSLSWFFKQITPFPVFSLKMDKERAYLFVVSQLLSIRYFLVFFTLSSFFSVKSLLDIVVVDYPSNGKRFEVTYVLTSLVFNFRVFLRTNLTEFLIVPSITGLFGSANWLEREAWDMFGVCFSNNLDLRRILTDYGFDGFPLRKDFPLSGFFEVRYDDSEKRIVVEPLEISQEFRTFTFLSPWTSNVN